MRSTDSRDASTITSRSTVQSSVCSTAAAAASAVWRMTVRIVPSTGLITPLYAVRVPSSKALAMSLASLVHLVPGCLACEEHVSAGVAIGNWEDVERVYLF